MNVYLKLQTSAVLGAFGVLGARRGCAALAGVEHLYCECRSRKYTITQEHKVHGGTTNTINKNLVNKYL